MQDAIEKLCFMGQMPNDNEDITDEKIEAYGMLLEEIKTPISVNDAENLVCLFPETGLFGLEWTLLHIFETVAPIDDSTYRKIVEQCPSNEWRETLLKRFNNYLNQ